MNYLKLLVIGLAYIMYGCTYETATPEDITSAEIELPTTPDNDMSQLQQRSKAGTILPQSSQKINFQLPYFLDIHNKLDPGNYTVQFGVDDPNTASVPGAQIRLRAEILWKIGGLAVRRVVDCGNGVSVSGAAEGVSVSVYDDSTGFVTPLPVGVSITVAKGTRPSVQQPPPYSNTQNSIAPSGSATIAIPPNIGALSVSVTVAPLVTGTAIGAYDILVIQANASGTTLKAYDPRQDQWVPLVPGATQIVIGTSAAAPALVAEVVFGIDG